MQAAMASEMRRGLDEDAFEALGPEGIVAVVAAVEPDGEALLDERSSAMRQIADRSGRAFGDAPGGVEGVDWSSLQ